MMIMPHDPNPTGFDALVKKMILNSEGNNIPVPHNIGDYTLTWGYGFTFIRKDSNDVWSRYGDLAADLHEIGITLTDKENVMLNNIVIALNKSDYKKIAPSLLLKFEQEWKKTRNASSGNPLSDPNAQKLYETEIWHKKDFILEKFISVLGNTNGLGEGHWGHIFICHYFLDKNR